MAYRFAFAAASVLALICVSGPNTTANAATIGIFGAQETRHEGLKPFPKWTEALERHLKTKQKDEGSCEATLFNRCHYKEWIKLLEEVRGKPPEYQLGKINYYMNRHRYIIDPINWGVRDYWAVPAQFFRKDGDCEDYAIAKYMSLRALGWDADKLRIIVLQDLNLRIAHAILAVYMVDKVLLLDNQISIVVDSRQVRHYKPFYAVNENGWWRLRSQ
jgi:predicted transglutaminase-like cysteine proteinase